MITLKLVDFFRISKARHRAMKVPFPAALDLTPPAAPNAGLVVGFYTINSFYESEAARMRSSALRVGLEVSTRAVESMGSWVRNASMKAAFLSSERASKRGPLLYVDVDAVFHGNPWPELVKLECDIAVYREKSRLIAATILINDTPGSMAILREWKARSERQPDIWDQVVLQGILDEDAASASPSYRVAELSVAFCWIFDRTSNEKVDRVYIEQLQASRTANSATRSGREGRRLKRREQRILEIEKVIAADKTITATGESRQALATPEMLPGRI